MAPPRRDCGVVLRQGGRRPLSCSVDRDTTEGYEREVLNIAILWCSDSFRAQTLAPRFLIAFFSDLLGTLRSVSYNILRSPAKMLTLPTTGPVAGPQRLWGVSGYGVVSLLTISIPLGGPGPLDSLHIYESGKTGSGG